jgi:hypothetical protein
MTDEEYKKEYAEAYEEGRQACLKDNGNMEAYENPYPLSDPQRTAWALGWGEEFARFMAALKDGDVT